MSNEVDLYKRLANNKRLYIVWLAGDFLAGLTIFLTFLVIAWFSASGNGNGPNDSNYQHRITLLMWTMVPALLASFWVCFRIAMHQTAHESASSVIKIRRTVSLIILISFVAWWIARYNSVMN